MKNNFISILITNYNKQKFLKKCLDSVCNQSFNNYEIILFDDCSIDNSLNIIKKYKRVKLIKNKKRSNKSAPLNQINGILRAFKKSRGNIICLMDADDYFVENKLKIIDKKFKTKDIDCIYNFPRTSKKQFIYRTKKNTNDVWPIIFPTSCITTTRSSFKVFTKYLQKNKYLNLEIDARLVIFFRFFLKEYNVIKNKLTIYNYDNNSITSKVKKYSINWWLRRFEAFKYLKYILSKKNIKFKASIDYFVTIFFITIIKTFKL